MSAGNQTNLQTLYQTTQVSNKGVSLAWPGRDPTVTPTDRPYEDGQCCSEKNGLWNENQALGTGISLQVSAHEGLRSPKTQDRLLLILLVSQHKKMVRPYCWIQHTLWVQDIKTPGWNWPGRKLSVLGDAMQAAGEETALTGFTLHSAEPCMP